MIMSKKIKMIIMDGDGSTLDQNGFMDSRLKNLIISRPDLKWVMATGRCMNLLRETDIFQFLSEETPHIVSGGAEIKYKNGDLMSEALLSHHDISTLFKLLKMNDVYNFIHFSKNGCNYFFSKNV